MTSAGYAARAYDARKAYPMGEEVVHALDGVTVGFERGRFTAIMGPSGSGKSTLLQCMAGLEFVDSGRLFVDDDELTLMNPTQLTLLRRDRMGFVFQSYNLVPSLTAEKNMKLPLKLAKRPVDDAWFGEVVTRMRLADRLGHRPGELSGGQQQRVAVARALVARPSVVFADEPTGNLDSASTAEVLRLLRQAVDSLGQTVVAVTHDPVVAAAADRVVFLADGRLAGDLEDPTVPQLIDRLKVGAR